jgi:hypothetical protein
MLPRSGSVRIGRVNDQLDRPAVGQSKRGGSEVGPGGVATNAEALCERHDRSVQQGKPLEAQAAMLAP